jgi:uncharacterized membrane protein
MLFKNIIFIDFIVVFPYSQPMNDSFSSSWNIIIHTVTTGLKDWGSLHPTIVHVPIALLLIAPLFIVIGMVCRKSAKQFYLCALILLLAGTLGIFLAVSTGEKASELIKPNPEVVSTLEAHEHLAEKIRLSFSLLTSIFLTYLLLFSLLTKRLPAKIHHIGLTLFLIIYTYNLVLLFNTAHQGGKLVHYHGVTSKLYLDKDLNK